MNYYEGNQAFMGSHLCMIIMLLAIPNCFRLLVNQERPSL